MRTVPSSHAQSAEETAAVERQRVREHKGKNAEAVSLYAKAEAEIRDEQFEACIASLDKAVSIFEKLGPEGDSDAGESGLIDALYMLSDAHRQMASTMYSEKFRASGNKRGQATMLLALAESSACT
ncbi:hypothetical protein AK812_SmicGene25168 [Symbiodinium microadriaticum]|uniref:Gamma-soluble NSF attachment protein n=1 Tax=Symbiodinium microadriaticum TaxID=2951 RepID=A0A1Q9DCL7_SYMMI|nr:hypothetical protein AK812_SmicGene25168 [Symbiodinium microadriaticum]